MKAIMKEEYRKLVRPLSEREYEDLKESIVKNGLLVPIIVNTNGEILDGHNRHKICQELNIRAQFVVKRFEDPDMERLYVIESNLKRRQLTDAERVELGMTLEPIYKELARKRQLAALNVGDSKPVQSTEAPSISNEVNGYDIKTPEGSVNEQVAKQVGMSETKYFKGKTVEEQGSEPVKSAWKSGKISTHKAYEETMNQNKSETERKVSKTVKKFRIKNTLFEQAIRALQRARDTDEAEIEVRVQGTDVVGIGKEPEIPA
jgi:ParB-like chromosome segregation protein Spo0J